MTKDFSAYDDIDLVKYVAFAPQSSLAWQRAFTEFDRRYNRFIGTVVYRKCNQRGYSRGHSYLADFSQDVYKKLLQNESLHLEDIDQRLVDPSIMNGIAEISAGIGICSWW